ncbi:DNA glycosylase [Dichotomocladium elegans]|nr:DNA glycosylase [Dichotomocladium elegans]
MTDERIATFVARVQKADSSNPFRELATAIIYQQLSGKVAEKIERRFIDLFGPPENAHKLWFPTPERVVDQSIETLRSVGLSIRKAEYIKGLAEKFIDKTITIEKLSTLSDEELSKLLCSVRGIGPWTADMYLMLNLGHPDVLPVSDLGVRKGVGIHFELKNKLPSPKEMEEATNIWRPYRSVGSWFMWQLMSITTL